MQIESQNQSKLQKVAKEQKLPTADHKYTISCLQPDEINTMINQQLGLLNKLTCNGKLTPEQIMGCDITNCFGKGECIDCGKITCLEGLFDNNRICVECEIKQIKTGRRIELVYRPYSDV